MTRISLVALVLAAASGCAIDSADAGDTESIESAVTIRPLAGTWTYSEIAPISTNCNTNAVHLSIKSFTVDTVAASSFRIVPSNGTAPFTCTISASSAFSCPNRAPVSVDLRPSTDAQLTLHLTATGVFSDSSHALGKQDAAVSCVGSQCNKVAPMPCGFVDDFSAHR